MSKNLLGRVLAASATLALAACGGGDGTYVASMPTPAPTPTPVPTSPPPPPQQSPTIFPDVTTSTTFAALGLEASGKGIPASALMRDGFSARFDATNNAYIIGLPLDPAGTFIATGENNSSWEGLLPGLDFNVLKPSASNPIIQLSYTSFGIAAGYYSSQTEYGFIAFGSATPASGIPLSGSARYDAYVSGSSLDAPVQPVGGTATLQFDFGAGTLAGHFDPILNPALPTSLGTYNFVNTVYGAGKTNFSGQLSISGASSPGAFDGQFTGPAAQELMARWTAPYLNPSTKQWSEMFGVWVGKKH